MFKIYNPRQTVLVSCSEKVTIMGKEVEKDNLIALDWHTPLSFEPLIYGIAIHPDRLSCEMIRKSRVFTVNFMPYSLAKEVLFCGRHSGRNTDKFREAGLTKRPGEKTDCPSVEESAAILECEVINEIEAGDHVFFIGKVVHSELKKDAKRPFHTVKDEFTTTEK